MNRKTKLNCLIKTIVFIFIFLNLTESKAQKLEWVLQANSPAPSAIYTGFNIKTDNDGRIYAAGQFLGDSIIINNVKIKNPGSGIANSYIARFSESGKLIWAQILKGLSSQRWIEHMGLDQDGFIYIVGFSVDGVTVGNLSCDGGGIFMAKLDSNGVAKWVKQMAPGGSFPRGFYIDKKGNSYFTGHFYGSKGLVGNITVNGTGTATSKTLFIAKVDSAGTVIWAEPFGSTSGTIYQTNLDIGIDALGNIYIVDGIADYITIGSKTYNHRTNNYYNSYMAKFNNSGKLLWSKFLNFDSDYGENIAVDSAGFIYMTASSYYADNAVFDTVIIKKSSAYNESITVKFDSTGKGIWGRHIPRADKSGESRSQPIFLTKNGDIYIVGGFNNHVQFGMDVYDFSNNYGGEGFIARYNNAGKEQGLYPLGYLSTYKNGVNGPDISQISLNRDNNIYFTGQFYVSSAFDMDTLTTVCKSSAMVGKISAFPIVMPDSMGYTYACSSPFHFILYFNTTPDSVLWDFGDGHKSNDISPFHSYGKKGNYDIIATSYINGKANTFKKTIVYAVQFSLGKDTTILPGKTLTLHSGYPNTKWSTGSIGDSINVSSAGTYWARVTTGNCVISDTIEVKSISGIKNNQDLLSDYNIQLIPNPTSGNIIIHFLATVSGSYMLYVTDVAGTEVYHQSFISNLGENTISLNFKDFKPGDYFASIEINGNAWHIKFIKE